MTIQQFLLILLARWRIALASFLGVILAAAAISLILPKKYSATATVVLDTKGTDPLTGAVVPGVMSSAYLATQVDIINSDRVAKRVVKLLKMDSNPQVEAQWREATDGKGSIDQWLAGTLHQSLDVKPSRESSVIDINFSAVDPKYAQAFANAFAQAYLDVTLDLRVEPARQSAKWFDERSRILRDNLEQAQARLSAYQLEHGIVATDERLDVESARLAELSSQLVGVQAQRSDTQSRQTQARSGTDAMPEVLQSGIIQGLKTDLARLEAKLQETTGQLGRNHPVVQRMESEAQALRGKIEVETKQVLSSISTANRVNQQREAELRASLEAQKARLLDLKRQRDEIAVLAREIDTAQRAYDAVAQRYTQTSLESQVNLTNVAVLNPAAEPITPSSPKTMKNLLIATFLGTLLGVGAAFLAEFIDRRVRSEEDLAALLDYAVLGSLSGKARRENRLAAAAAALFARLNPRAA